MKNFMDLLMFFVWVMTIITALSVKGIFLVLHKEFHPTFSEYGNILLLHILLSGLVWGCTDRSLTSLFIVVILCVYLTFGISTFILARIRYIEQLEEELKRRKE